MSSVRYFGEPVIHNPALRRSMELYSGNSNANPAKLRNYQNLRGDLDALSGDAHLLTGNATNTWGEIPDGHYGCVTGWDRDIAEMPKGRMCNSPNCRHCRKSNKKPVLMRTKLEGGMK